MKYVKTFEDFQVSEGFRYHMENGLDITNSVYRIGSEAYKQLFEETKKYWDENNIILSDKAAWMAKNLEVGKEAVYDGRKVELDTPKRGGDKKFVVYHNSGKKDDEGNIEAVKWMMERNLGDCFLEAACQSNNLEIILYLKQFYIFDEYCKKQLVRTGNNIILEIIKGKK